MMRNKWLWFVLVMEIILANNRSGSDENLFSNLSEWVTDIRIGICWLIFFCWNQIPQNAQNQIWRKGFDSAWPWLMGLVSFPKCILKFLWNNRPWRECQDEDTQERITHLTMQRDKKITQLTSEVSKLTDQTELMKVALASQEENTQKCITQLSMQKDKEIKQLTSEVSKLADQTELMKAALASQEENTQKWITQLSMQKDKEIKQLTSEVSKLADQTELRDKQVERIRECENCVKTEDKLRQTQEKLFTSDGLVHEKEKELRSLKKMLEKREKDFQDVQVKLNSGNKSAIKLTEAVASAQGNKSATTEENAHSNLKTPHVPAEEPETEKKNYLLSTSFNSHASTVSYIPSKKENLSYEAHTENRTTSTDSTLDCSSSKKEELIATGLSYEPQAETYYADIHNSGLRYCVNTICVALNNLHTTLKNSGKEFIDEDDFNMCEVQDMVGMLNDMNKAIQDKHSV